MAGISSTGFTTKVLTDILTDKRATAVTLFQDQVQPGDVVDTSDSALLGRLVSLDSPSEADLWQAAQQVYSAFDANSATGISLDNMIAISGIPSRFQNTNTTGQVLLSGDTGTVITSGSVVSSPTTSEQFSTIANITLTSDGSSGITVGTVVVADLSLYSLAYTRSGITSTISYTSGVGATSASIIAGIKSVIITSFSLDLVPTLNTNGSLKIDLTDIFNTASWIVSANLGILKVVKLGDITAINVGPVAQPFNTITQIQTPILGWDSVTNPLATTPGRIKETDEELRLRFRNTKFERATGTVESVYSALFSLDNVTQVFIDENETDITNSNGTPGHSFLVLIEGGTSAEIAKAIFENKPGGILSFGNTTVAILDKYKYTRNVRFSRPTLVPVYIKIDISEYQNFPVDGETQIRNALIAYVNGLSIGQDIVYSRLYTPINSVTGHEIASLLTGTVNPPTTSSNIVLAFDQVAQLLPQNIVFV